MHYIVCTRLFAFVTRLVGALDCAVCCVRVRVRVRVCLMRGDDIGRGL